MYSCIVVEKDAQVARITLNRPLVRNAFNSELIEEIVDAARELDADREIKVVIISGAGESFCSGFDLKQFAVSGDPSDVRHTVQSGRTLAQKIAEMRAITVAAVQGHCVGGGLVLMMACDFRYAASDARFKLPETDIGIPLAWGGVPWMTRELGPLLTMELILTCREVTAKDALSHRLVNDVVAPEQLAAVVSEAALRLTRHSSLVLEATKQQIAAAKEALCTDAHSYSDAYVLYSALLDADSQQCRQQYLRTRDSEKSSASLRSGNLQETRNARHPESS